VLITGGAGFIGSHVADALLARGYDVRVLDALLPQVHGDTRRPAYLDRSIELMIGDVRDPDAVRRALDGADIVFHFAARVGVGQSMYELAEYTSTNNLGTAVLLEAMLERRDQIERLVVASSMSIYGEGLYRDETGAVHEDVARTREQLVRGEWEPRGPEGRTLLPLPTPETKRPALASIYALSKYDQERMCLLAGTAYQIPTVALRFFNVYGPRQALSNPYTGVLAIFASRLLNGAAPMIYEDGRQRRDFVHVGDVVRACLLALDSNDAIGHAFNIGSGHAYTIHDIADLMSRALGDAIPAAITGQHRVGDIRHCTADIALAQRLMGYQPSTELEVGLSELAGWLATQRAVDRVDAMHADLSSRGLAL